MRGIKLRDELEKGMKVAVLVGNPIAGVPINGFPLSGEDRYLRATHRVIHAELDDPDAMELIEKT